MHVIFIVNWIPGMNERQKAAPFTDIKVISSDWWKHVNNAVSEHRLCRPARGQLNKWQKGKIPRTFEHEAHATPVSAQQLTLSLPRLLHYRTVNCCDRQAADTVPQREACPEEEEKEGRDCFWCVQKHELISSKRGCSCMHAPHDCALHTYTMHSCSGGMHGRLECAGQPAKWRNRSGLWWDDPLLEETKNH